TVQTALAELDAEKLALAGGTMSGDITMGANDIFGTGAITATTFTGDITGDVTGNADTATLASTVLINYSSSNADAATGGTEYSSTASLASGTRTFLRGSIPPFNTSNTFNAGINLNSESIITISTTSEAYSTQGGLTLPLQVLISSIDDVNNTFTISTYNWNGSTTVYQSTAPDINFTFNFQIFK
ncbi:hypothetical protein OAN30_04845, partial [Flavobacteriaceae bacterium]|nr:hypothetical protein [Flavobacteriaceae bacterium]